jgi:hypothetical protein
MQTTASAAQGAGRHMFVRSLRLLALIGKSVASVENL